MKAPAHAPLNAAANDAVKALLQEAVLRLSREADVRYAEARWVDQTTERLRVRDGRPEVASRSSSGVAIRVLGSRTWGFSCTPEATVDAVKRAADRALAVARASSIVARATVPFPPRAKEEGTYATPLAIDPFAVSLEEKLAVLDGAVRALAGAPVRSAEAWMSFTRVDKRLVTSEGTDVAQRFVYGACGMHAIAIDDAGRPQRRSYPTWSGGEGFQGGYERVASLDLEAHAPRVREELAALCTAPPCPAGLRDLILESSQMALQIHESCGHPTELDRALGHEVSLAGGSFLQPPHLDRLRYGSELVNLTADAVTEGGLGTFGWDDEGIPSGRHDLVREGLFVGYLTSRETAAAIGREPTGAMRAESFERPPIIRMVNVSLEPGEGTLAELVADTKDGVLVATDRSWSIDDLRYNFQFTCEIAWEIKDGKLGRVLRDPLYTGITPAFWGSCDAVCGPSEQRLWGVGNCGKGDPMQIMRVGHAAAPARFRRVELGSASGRAKGSA